MKKDKFYWSIIAIILICLFSINVEKNVYKDLSDVLQWSNETLYLNVVANRNLLRECRGLPHAESY